MLLIEQISENLRRLGLKLMDCVMVHSAFSSLGTIENGADGFIKALEDVIGPQGTIVMPTYNWDILHQGEEIVFDIKNTPSKMGFLTEYFRSQPGTKRSKNIFNPLGYRGGLSDKLALCPHTESWGKDSPFMTLYEENAAILMIGVDYNVVTMFHVAEAMMAVPYRFMHEFPNAFFIDELGRKEMIRNTTLRRYNGYPTDFNVMEDIFLNKHLVRKHILGNAVVRLLRAKDLVGCVMEELKRDKELLIRKTLSRKWIDTRSSKIFQVKDFINKLWLKNRALISDGYDESLKEIARHIPLDIKKYPSGMSVWDWTIPKKWANYGGTIRSLSGKVLFDLSGHPLNIAAGSISFKGKIVKTELLKHIKTDHLRPCVIPYHTCYYDNDWFICLAHESLDKLEGNDFVVEINCENSNGELKIGECTIKGAVEDSIVIPLHLDHPAQCNDNLSGVAVAIDLILKLQKSNDRLKHTLRFVFLPETIGIFTYLSQNKETIPKIKWGLVFDSVGTRDELMFMKSFEGDSRIDICTELAFKKLVSKFSAFSFLEITGYGNDERGLQVPGVRIPTVSIARFPFKEFHSSLDIPDIISTQSLKEVQEIVREIIRTIDLDFIPVRKHEGIVQLSKMDSLKTMFLSNTNAKKAIHKFFFLIDGIKSVSQIAFEAGVGFEFTYNLFMELKKHNKIEVKEAI